MYLAIPIILVVLFTLLVLKCRAKLLKEYDSPLLGKVRVWKKYNGELLLSTNGFSQGISTHDKSITKSYWYYQSQQVIAHCKEKKNPTILWLGLGAAAGPHIVAKALPDVSQTAVEFDETIIQADREFFHLDDIKNLTTVRADAYIDIKKLAKEKKQFDVIVNDIYLNADLVNGEKSSDGGFLKDVMTCLKPDGLLLFNRLAQTQEHISDTEKLMPYLKKHFTSVEKNLVKDPRIYKNEIISAEVKR